MSVFNLPDRRGLLANVGLALLTVIVVNGMIFGFGWNQSTDTPIEPSFAPPGWVIGSIWLALFMGMGAARWLLVRRSQQNGVTGARLVVLLMAACLIYPFYTIAPDSTFAGLIGNLLTLLVAAGVAWYTWRISTRATALVLAVAVWLSFAAFLTVRILQLNA